MIKEFIGVGDTVRYLVRPWYIAARVVEVDPEKEAFRVSSGWLEAWWNFEDVELIEMIRGNFRLHRVMGGWKITDTLNDYLLCMARFPGFDEAHSFFSEYVHADEVETDVQEA